MKRTLSISLALAAIVCCAAISPRPLRADYTPPASSHLDLNFNYDWKFIKEDVKGGAQAPGFDDSSWSAVSLPHTWNDDKFRSWVFEEKTYSGKAWYRKHFTPDAAWAGRKVTLEFQCIGRVATFYINGEPAGEFKTGVAPCGIDITDKVKFGADNVIAVMVDGKGDNLPYGFPFNPIFGGITGDVILHVTDKVYQTLPLFRNLGTAGTYIYPTNIDTLNKSATVNVEPEVKNETAAPQNVSCTSTVVDATGSPVLTLASAPQPIASGTTATFKMSGNLAQAHLWSPDYPYLYKVYTTTSVDGKATDVHEITTGFRKVSFSAGTGLLVNGRPLYLKGYAPRTSMEWPCVGVPVDWMQDLDFKLMRDDNGNFCRPMHIAPHPSQVEAADKFGIVMVCPAANNEGDEKFDQRADIMRDVIIAFRNSPSVFFYEGCNQTMSAGHTQAMKDIRLKWDPSGGRMSGLRSNDKGATDNIREYGATMDGAGTSAKTPTWDAEYARAEGPRRVWDDFTPMLNPRWDGKNPDPTPAAGTVGDTTHKYLLGGYFYISSDAHQALGLGGKGEASIGEYMDPDNHNYFRLQNSEDLVLENLAKYWARYMRSAIIQSPGQSEKNGVMVGGAKIIWSDSVTDGRMKQMEVTRTSGVIDGARLPKELYWAFQVAQGDNAPAVYILGHWNYAKGTVKRVYVVANTPQVRLQTYDPEGKLIKDYGQGKTDFFPDYLSRTGDQVNHYVFAFDNVEWQPGSIKAIGADAGGKQLAEAAKNTVGAPVAIKLTPVTGPSQKWFADGSDIAMFDVEVVDANGNRCPTYEDAIDFSCSGEGIFLGGYNSGIRDSTNIEHKTSGYKLNVECGINRVFVRSTRKAGTFTLNASSTAAGEPQLKAGSASLTSEPFEVANGLTAQWPQKYTLQLGAEPPGAK